MWEFTNYWLSILANWFEVIGFVITIFTAFKVYSLNQDVRTISNRYLWSLRSKDHLTDLQKISKNIAGLLTDSSNTQQSIRLEVSHCIEVCKSIKRKTGKSDLSNITGLIKISKRIIDKKANQPIEQGKIEEFYLKLDSLIREIDNLNKDLKRLQHGSR